MKCADCRYHFALSATHDKVDWKNCLALPYPECTQMFTRADAECGVPHLALPIIPLPTELESPWPTLTK